MPRPPRFGFEDTTYQAAGGNVGIARLVATFYDLMSRDPAYAAIWQLHAASRDPDRLAETQDRLSHFLVGWMGGPRIYREKYGPISIPGVHAHLPISIVHRDQWLDCMATALAQQHYPDPLRDYLLEQLAIPADRILQRTSQ